MLSDTQNNIGTYVLDESGEPVRERNTLVWARWFEATTKEGRKHIGDDTVGPYRVSTVFLGLDYSFVEGPPPILWETMIFGLPDLEFRGGRYRKEVFCDRYASKADALTGHARAVKLAESLPQSVSAPDGADPIAL